MGPTTCTILGLAVDNNGQATLDCYSTIRLSDRGKKIEAVLETGEVQEKTNTVQETGEVQQEMGPRSVHEKTDVVQKTGQVLVDENVLPCYPSWSDHTVTGDLVSVQGKIMKVDEERSLQWLACPNCNREDLREVGQVYHCSSCARDVTPVEQVELVCRVLVGDGQVWLQLAQNMTKHLLSQLSKDGGVGLSPEDVIGQDVGPVVCICRGDILVDIM